MSTQEQHQLVEQFEEFLSTYYKQEVADLAQHYPKERQSIQVEYSDLFQFNADLAEDYRENPARLKECLSEALSGVELPIDAGFENARVRVTDTNEYLERIGVGDLGQEHLGELVALRCQIGKVSERNPRLKVGAFMCGQCGSVTEIPQPFMDTQEPHECQSCGRQGPFDLDDKQSKYVNQRKLRLEAPPENDSDGEVIAYCLHELADAADGQLIQKAGSRVTILGTYESDMSSLFGRGSNEPVPDQYFVPESFVWDSEVGKSVEVEEHREEVERWASEPNAIDIFAHNIDPSLVVVDGWQHAIEMATAYLFGAPRINPERGDTIRGDIHMLFVTDPGMNKSAFSSKLADLSPKAVLRDSEAMSSSVGLTAAATQGGFGDDSWTIEPGALPKANGGHIILDEIDKGPDGFMDGIHSPLEGEQVLNVEKAGQEATLPTRCALLALGNPVDGEFDPYGGDIAEQVDLHPALMSRFDVICGMTDTPDREIDREVATGMLDSIDESARLEYGELDATDAVATAGEVSRDVMKAWVKIARDEVSPILTDGAKKILQDYYVDTRDRNEDSDTQPVTARKLASGWRIAAAFARVELSETVDESHAERATEILDQVVSLNYDIESGEFDANRTTETPSTQQQRVEAIKDAIRGDEKTPEEVAEETNIDVGKVENRLETLAQNGQAIRPKQGEYRLA